MDGASKEAAILVRGKARRWWTGRLRRPGSWSKVWGSYPTPTVTGVCCTELILRAFAGTE